MLGLALEGWSIFFCTGLAVEIAFFICVVFDGGLGMYGVGIITRGAAMVAVGDGEVGWVGCMSAIEEGDWGALVGFCCGEEQGVMRGRVVTSIANEMLKFIKNPQRTLPIQVRSFLQVLLDLQ